MKRNTEYYKPLYEDDPHSIYENGLDMKTRKPAELVPILFSNNGDYQERAIIKLDRKQREGIQLNLESLSEEQAD